MSKIETAQKENVVACKQCPLRANKRMRDFTPDELTFIQDFKAGELWLKRGATILSERTSSDRVFTILEGFAFRYKMLEDGRRQILNYSLPGDLIGIQSAMMAEMDHSVEALSDVRLCIFERKRFMTLYREHPALGYDLTWMAAREEQVLDEHLLSIGRRSALERAAYLLAFLANRARETGFLSGSIITLPMTQAHVADTLGLSTVHTNKTLRKLAALKLIAWQEGGCAVLESEGLNRIAKWRPGAKTARPFL
jgi:CRP/FNR family transcriptional regulator, anaerobic regulatory protein